MDPAMSDAFMTRLTTFGMDAVPNWLRLVVTFILPDAEKCRWKTFILGSLPNGVVSSDDAFKMTGRFSWTCCSMALCVGRAHLKPIYAQATVPMAGSRINSWLHNSLYYNPIGNLWRHCYFVASLQLTKQ